MKKYFKKQTGVLDPLFGNGKKININANCKGMDAPTIWHKLKLPPVEIHGHEESRRKTTCQGTVNASCLASRYWALFE